MKNIFLILITFSALVSCNGTKGSGKAKANFEITEAVLQEQVPGIEEQKPYYKFTAKISGNHGDLMIEIGELSTDLKDFNGILIGKFRPEDHSAIKEDLKEKVEVVVIEKTTEGSNRLKLNCKVIEPIIMP